MSIIRIKKKEHPYVQVDKRVLEDSRLSWRAKGILVYLLTKPDGWTVKVADIWGKGQEGRGAVQACLKELEKHGYAQLVTIKGEGTTFAGKEWQVNEEPIGGFLADTDKPKTDAPTNRKPDSRAVNSNNESLTEINSNNEGERTPPAPNPSTSKEEKKENGLVAPGREKSTADIIFEMAAEYGIEAEIPPSKKVAPKKDSPEYFEAEPYLGEFQRWRKCFHCAGTGFQLTGEVCAMCEGDGIGRDKKEPAQQFDVTAIASPTRLPGVTLVEAAPKPIQPWERPLPGSPKELKNVLLRYSEENPENWRDNVLESGRATGMTKEKIDEYLTDFCQWQFQQDSTKGRLSQYTAGFSLWLKRQPRFEVMNAPKEGSPTRGFQAQKNGKANLNHWGANPGGYEEKQAF